MRQKLLITLMVLVMAAIVFLMARDLFAPDASKGNPWAYKLTEFKKADSIDFCYAEAARWTTDLKQLRAIAIAPNGNVLLAGDKLLVWSPQGEALNSIALPQPARCLGTDTAGRIYVGSATQVTVLEPNGSVLAEWPAHNAQSILTSIATKGDRIYVADAGNKVVLKYSRSGELLGQIGRKDSIDNPLGFVLPSPYLDVAIGRQGELWVSNPGLHRFMAFNEGGELFSSWEHSSMQWDGFSGCCNPTHFALLSDGAFVTSEKGLVRVKVHAPNGDFRCAVAAPAHLHDAMKHIDIAVDAQDQIWLAIAHDNSVRLYRKPQMPAR